MVKFIGKRLISAVGLIVLVTLVTFALLYRNGMGIARTILGSTATQEQVVAKYHELGLDQPVLTQYVSWLGRAFRGDLGRSFLSGEEVLGMLGTRIPITMALVFVTLLFTLVISTVFGVTAAVRGGWVDRVLQIASMIGGAVPQFIVAVGLVVLFALKWPVFPATGYTSPDVSVAEWAIGLVLPVTAILVGTAAGGALQLRGTMKDALAKDYVQTLRTRGISERSVLFKHALRNAAGPGLIGMGFLVIGMLGGSVLIERVFAMPGLGMLANNSTMTGDVPVVMATVLFTVLVVVTVNIVIDLLLGWLNPKVRLA